MLLVFWWHSFSILTYMKNLTYFQLSEFITSYTASICGIDNTPDFESVENIHRLCVTVLEPARKLLGKPICITSGFRCPALNTKVNGKPNSQHMKGLAADIQCSGSLETLFDILAINPNIDQLLFEDNGKRKWIHVSIAPPYERPRNIIKRDYKVY